MTLTDDDRLWRDQNDRNMPDNVLEKIVETFGHCNGNSNVKDKDQKEKKKIPIKKYTANGRLPLHESLILGLDSKFVTLDSQGKPEFKDNIDLNDTQELVPGDTIHTQNPLPYIFDSQEEFKEYLELARKETFDSLYLMIDSIFRKYVNVEEHYYAELVGNTIWSWFQDKFGYTHYIIIIGDNGSGKNSALLVYRLLGYRVFYVVSASAANYYTQLGTIEEGQCTIAEDEAEDLAEDKDKRNVVKTGYCSGGSVPKIDLEGGRRQDNWLTYCNKWYAMEELSENKRMKGVLDRSLVLKFVTGDVPYNIKDVIRSAGDPKYEPLFRELMHTRKLLFCFRLLHYNDPILDVELNIKNRSAELTKPLIRLFQNSPIALERIMESLSIFMVERNEVKKNSIESKLYDTLMALIEDESLGGEDVLIFKNEGLREKLKEIVDGHDLPDKEGVFYSADIGEVSQTRITRTLKSKFKGKPVPKKIEGKTYRCIQLQRKVLDRIKSNYSIPDKIEIVTGTETEKPQARPEAQQKVTLVTEVTLSRNIEGLHGDTLNPVRNLIYEKNIINHINNRENYENLALNPTLAMLNNEVKEADILPESVTSVTSVTESPQESANVKVKCPNCDYETERFFMKLHQCPNIPLMLECEICTKNHKKRFKTSDKEDYKNHMLTKHHAGD